MSAAKVEYRLKRIDVPYDVIGKLLSIGGHAYAIVDEGIPEDGVVTRVAATGRRTLSFIIYSPSFPALRPGEPIPLLRPEIIGKQATEKIITSPSLINP